MKTPLFSQVEDFEDMKEFGIQREVWLKSILSLPFEIPKHDTFNRVLSHIKPGSLSQCLTDDGNALLGLIKGAHISFDGKKTKAMK